MSRGLENSLMLGFLNTNLWLSLSSTQSISLPMMLNSALLSISTRTPSCSTVSSNAPGLSTYSRWYASPLHPRFRTPTLISFGSGWSSRARSWSTADGVSFMAALRGARSFERGLAFGVVAEEGVVVVVVAAEDGVVVGCAEVLVVGCWAASAGVACAASSGCDR